MVIKCIMKFKIAYNENNPMKTTRITQQRTRRRNRSLPMFRLLPTRRFFYLHDLFYLHHIPFIAEARQSVCPSVRPYIRRVVSRRIRQSVERTSDRKDRYRSFGGGNGAMFSPNIPLQQVQLYPESEGVCLG